MHRSAAGLSRSTRLIAAVAAAVTISLGVAGPGVAAEIEPQASPNRLDRPIVDLAVLDPAGGEGAPRLLTLDTLDLPDGIVRATVLQRDRAWAVDREWIVDLRANEVGHTEAPWLVRLGPTTFAMLAVATGIDQTIVIGLRTDQGAGGNEVVEMERTMLPIGISDAGAADVDGDGSPELVLAAARTLRQGGACQGSELWTIDPATLGIGPVAPGAMPRDPAGIAPGIAAPGSPRIIPERRLAGGVIGAFDEVPGDDLAVYAYPNCPAGPDQSAAATLMRVRLADGTIVSERPAATEATPPYLPAPLRVDVDGDGAHELVAQSPRGLTVVDPRIAGDGVRVGGAGAVPLVAAPAIIPAPEGGDVVTAGATIAWLEPPEGRPGRVGTERVRRVDGDLRGSPATVMFPNGEPTVRWDLIQTDILGSSVRQLPPTAWMGGIDDAACPDVLLPGAVLGCASGDLVPGAAWLATRPVTLYGEGQGQRLLVASGIGWVPDDGLPASPAPWAVGPGGWWRHGPSSPFVLAELRAADATYYREFPTPRATLERATAPDATSIIPGFTGVRFFVTVTALTPTATEPVDIDTMPALSLSPSDVGQFGVVRIPVPPGVDSGRDGAATVIPIGDITLPDGASAERWDVTAVPLNDWGEIGGAVIGAVIRDRVGPSLAVDTPFMTPVWPLPASIKGSAEPGALVEVAGVGPVELDRRGNFRIPTSLAPWPQTLRVTATDASGNRTETEVSLIGGVDYRRFPWPMIAAVVLLVVVAISGMSGSRWRRVAAAGSSGAVGRSRGIGDPAVRAGGPDRGFAMYDDVPMAEIEDLPPGQGIGRA